MRRHHITICLLATAFLATAALAQTSKPVDTRQLGLIRPGMSQAEVRERLGPPAEIIDLGYRTYTHYKSDRHSKVSRTTHLEKWIYPGNFSYPPAGIVFESGRVKSARRE